MHRWARGEKEECALRGLFESESEAEGCTDSGASSAFSEEELGARQVHQDVGTVEVRVVKDSTGVSIFEHCQDCKLGAVSIHLFDADSPDFEKFHDCNGFVMVKSNLVSPILSSYGFHKELSFDELEDKVLKQRELLKASVLEILKNRLCEDWAAIVGSGQPACDITSMGIRWASSLASEDFWNDSQVMGNDVLLVPLFHAEKTRRVSFTGSSSNPPAVYYPHLDLLPDYDVRSWVFEDFGKRFKRHGVSDEAFAEQFELFIGQYDMVARNVWISFCETHNHQLALATPTSISLSRDLTGNRRVKHHPSQKWCAPGRISFGTTYIFDTQRAVHSAVDFGTGGERLSAETRFVVLSKKF